MSFESFEQFLQAADADPSVVGLILIGSRSFDGMATSHSDHDVIAVVADGHAWETSRSRSLDVAVVPLADFPRYAMPDHAESWNRYAFVHAQVLRDRLDGRIAELVHDKRRLAPDEARSLARGALDAYTNSAYRSLKSVRDDRLTAARLDAAESIPHLLTTLFAAYGRVRPYNKYLDWELRANALSDLAFAHDRFVPQVERILADGDPDTQREVFGIVERVMRARGFGDVFDAWGSGLRLLRPAGADADRRLAAAERVVAFSAAGAEFVETVRKTMAPYQDVELPTTDLVHGDVNPGNILMVGDRISGLVDAEALGKGTRFHDVAGLLVYAQLWDGEPGAVEDLYTYADRHAARGELEVSMASCLLGILEFVAKLRSDDADRAQVVDGKIRKATELLRQRW